MSTPAVSVHYYSDLLCVWAYAAEVRLDELCSHFADAVQVEYRFLPIFGSTRQRIGERWQARGGYPAYAEHVREVAGRFDHLTLHDDVWTRDVPSGSFAAHAFVRALSGVTGQEARVRELSRRLRLAFFRDGRDISRLEVQLAVAEELGLPIDAIRARLDDGRAWAELAEDYEHASRLHVTGSPTFVLNEGRQILYGNVGYRIVEANVQELLRNNEDRASWC